MRMTYKYLTLVIQNRNEITIKVSNQTNNNIKHECVCELNKYFMCIKINQTDPIRSDPSQDKPRVFTTIYINEAHHNIQFVWFSGDQYMYEIKPIDQRSAIDMTRLNTKN